MLLNEGYNNSTHPDKHKINYLDLLIIKKVIEELISNEIDLDEDIPENIIDSLAKLHSDIELFKL